ncbi:MAG: prephenate dehydrogenase/arogenate dehydrogenase family protein, partial [Methylococcales bacterium]
MAVHKNSIPIRRICIIGMGLIGGSLAKALKKSATCSEIIGCDSSQKRLDTALQLKAIDSGSTEVSIAVKDADVIILAAPIGAMTSVFESIVGHISPTTIITDVGSTKRSVVKAAQNIFDKLPNGFVPAHPLVGGEKSGVENSSAELFTGCNVVITPLDTSSKEAVEMVRQIWHSTGANVFELDVDRHDEILGATSHLPHVLAYLLVDILASSNKKDDIFRYAAGGFIDFTRIASSDPGLWCDISLANSDVLSSMLESYGEALSQLSRAISQGDKHEIK